jgi:hypothetical protein
MVNSDTNGYACPRCTVGRCQRQTAPFVDMYNGQLFCVPDTPIYVCDVCHFAEFALDALESLWEKLDATNVAEDFPTITGKNRSSPLSD